MHEEVWRIGKLTVFLNCLQIEVYKKIQTENLADIPAIKIAKEEKYQLKA